MRAFSHQLLAISKIFYQYKRNKKIEITPTLSPPPSRGECVVITKSAIKTVIPAKAGIQNLLKILDSVSRFACTE